MPNTHVHYIRSRFAGEASDPIDRLLERLAEHPLERLFERAGGFGEDRGGGVWSFFGNFRTLSAAFRLETDDPSLIARLQEAIAANMLRPDYLAQPAPFRNDLVRIERKRFSTTQGEVELFYGELRIGQFGDTITLTDGEWDGRHDSCWLQVAYGWFIGGRLPAGV
jgi:hypothetical protein